MKQTINYIKKKLHNSKLCRNFLLILTVATLCIYALCVPISAESPLSNQTRMYINREISNEINTVPINDFYEANLMYNTEIVYISTSGDYYDIIQYSSIDAGYIEVKLTNSISEVTDTILAYYSYNEGINYQLSSDTSPIEISMITEEGTILTPEEAENVFSSALSILNLNLSNTAITEAFENMRVYTQNSTSILNIFGNIGNWIANAISNVTAMFWANGSLTFIGVLAVGGLGISIVLFLIRLISSFLAFRG